LFWVLAADRWKRGVKDGTLRTEDGRQRTEGKGQKAEKRGLRSEFKNVGIEKL